ncbi:MAG: peptidylprolyl isomerase [Gemmataceae bacterium]
MSFRSLPRRSSRRSAPSFRVEQLESRCTPAVSLFTVPGAVGAHTSLDFDWNLKMAANNNELAVYVVQDAAGTVNGLAPTDAGYAAAALTASQVVFAKGTTAGAHTTLSFNAGDRLAFLLVQNHTVAQAVAANNSDQLPGPVGSFSDSNASVPLAFFSVSSANPDKGIDHVKTQLNGDGAEQFSWEDQTGGGDGDFNDMVMTVGEANARAIATPGQAGQTVTATFHWDSGNPWFKNELGLYVTNNAQGLVNGLSPGAAGYEQAALTDPSRQIIFQRFSGVGATTTVTLPAGSFFGLYLVAQGTTAQALAGGPNAPHVYFLFPAANADNFDHVQWLSGNSLGFEDMFGGGDKGFEDLQTSFTFGTPTGTAAEAGPFVKAQIAPVSLTASASQTVDVAGNFDDADIQDTLVTLNTSAGPVHLELFDRAAPRTVANFLNYLNSGRYNESIFHRSAKNSNGTPFVLQGGGFTFDSNGGASKLDAITTDPAIQAEPDTVNRSNVKGTIAMALLGNDPNSATDEFFFNLGDNSGNLNTQNGGFTVFGKLVGAADQAVVDALAAVPTKDESNASALPASEHGVFSEIPLQNYNGSNFPTDTTLANYDVVSNGAVTSRPEFLTYSVVGNTNPTVVTASVVNERVTVQGLAAGTSTITVRATDQVGKFVDTSFTVTVK